MKSYLANRTQCVIVDQNLSKDVTLATGVPQGSVLGPLLYTLYVAPLHDLIISANMQTGIYADDIQLFTSFHPDHCSDAIQKIQNCIADVKSWAISNNLFINDSKTEILHATSQFKSTTIKSISVKMDQNTITPSTHVKSLGVVLDPHLSMKQQLNAVCKSSYNAVRKISRIRKFLTNDITTKLVCSLIMPRLDYCNSLLFGLPDSTLKKLQTVQNSAARLISCSSRHDHISPVLQSLHWLPVKQRSIYKLLLLTYKSQHSLAPGYITNLIPQYHPQRQLRSSTKCLLATSHTPNTKFYGERAFISAAPHLWNNLPSSIRNAPSVDCLKRLLKTHLFQNLQ
ncbi:ORF2-encoded protein [Apostichopus japonicus]|uniref:ORF2-encoded protein n=1 Tax=Stichopus japonicus TaxID=307972 RepID=A0A2G8K2C3_STIJA|nr:ORF2-encoded protein [Apostichopus japonicus]